MSPISLKPTALVDAISKNSIVLFHASWCGHCTRFMPEYERLAEEAKTSLPGVHVTRIDFAKYGDQVRKMNVGDNLMAGGVAAHVKGYPTVAFFSEQKMSVYTGPRERGAIAAAMKEFMAEAQTMANEELLSVDNAATDAYSSVPDITPEELKSAVEQNSFVMAYAPWCGHCKKAMPTVERLKDAMPHVNVVKVDFTKHSDEIKQLGIAKEMITGYPNGVSSVVQGFPTFLMFGNHQVAEYTGDRTVEAMKTTMADFLEAHRK